MGNNLEETCGFGNVCSRTVEGQEFACDDNFVAERLKRFPEELLVGEWTYTSAVSKNVTSYRAGRDPALEAIHAYPRSD